MLIVFMYEFKRAAERQSSLILEVLPCLRQFLLPLPLDIKGRVGGSCHGPTLTLTLNLFLRARGYGGSIHSERAWSIRPVVASFLLAFCLISASR